MGQLGRQPERATGGGVGGNRPARLTRGDEPADLTVGSSVVRGKAPSRVQPQKEIAALSPGDRVSHTTFGEGRVDAVAGAGDKTVATVTFLESGAQKRLLLRYAPLTRIEG